MWGLRYLLVMLVFLIACSSDEPLIDDDLPGAAPSTESSNAGPVTDPPDPAAQPEAGEAPAGTGVCELLSAATLEGIIGDSIEWVDPDGPWCNYATELEHLEDGSSLPPTSDVLLIHVARDALDSVRADAETQELNLSVNCPRETCQVAASPFGLGAARGFVADYGHGIRGAKIIANRSDAAYTIWLRSFQYGASDADFHEWIRGIWSRLGASSSLRGSKGATGKLGVLPHRF
jgi:hypothetical protein